jgi:SAM-dependent methyltransferase
MSFLSNMLAHPLTRGMSLDDPETTALRSRIIHEKIFLRKIYESWYQLLVSHIPEGIGTVLEVGSGGGFLKELQKDALASEVFLVPNIDVVFDAMILPFKHESLRAVLMVDVLHHIPDPALFFNEAARCVRSGGRCLFIEPWNTPWGRWVYQNLHHEPFNPEGGWTIPSSGPLSGANGALPWILFERDRQLFVEKFPQWRIVKVTPMMPLAYLISGGVSMRSIMPGWAYRLVRAFEKLIPSVEKKSGMFAFIMLERL